MAIFENRLTIVVRSHGTVQMNCNGIAIKVVTTQISLRVACKSVSEQRILVSKFVCYKSAESGVIVKNTEIEIAILE